jgi:uncharacterized OB-fold protein
MRSCATCQWAGMPVRKVCPQCSGTSWEEITEVMGTVTAVTAVHRAFGQTFTPPKYLALISFPKGGSIVTSTDEPLPVNVQVTIDAELRIQHH